MLELIVNTHPPTHTHTPVALCVWTVARIVPPQLALAAQFVGAGQAARRTMQPGAGGAGLSTAPCRMANLQDGKGAAKKEQCQ